MEVNSKVVNGFIEFDLTNYDGVLPKYASPSCLSVAMQALWTNRVPMHEPWPRVLKVDTENINDPTDEYNRNTHHYDQYDNKTSPDGLQPIGVIEGDEEIERKDFWRR